MGDISRFIEAAIITAVFAGAAVCMNYSAHTGCGQHKSITAIIERGPARLVMN